MFTLDQKKEFVLEAKFRAQFEKIRTEAIRKEIQDNRENYSDKELEVLNRLLQRSIEDYEKAHSTYINGTVHVGAEDLLFDIRKSLESIKRY